MENSTFTSDMPKSPDGTWNAENIAGIEKRIEERLAASAIGSETMNVDNCKSSAEGRRILAEAILR